MTNFPDLHIGHQKIDSKEILKIELSNGVPDQDVESTYLHRHNFFMLTIFEEGDGEHIIDFNEHTIQPNRLFILKPGQVHLLKTNDKSICATVQFTDKFAYRHNPLISIRDNYPFFTFSNSSAFIDLPQQKSKELFNLMKKMYSEKNASFSNTSILANYLFIILEKLKIEFKSSEPHQVKLHPIIGSFFQLIDKNHKEFFSVAAYANKLSITSNYLNILCKKETGQPASKHIYNRVILEAKRLLAHSTLTVSQIAHELNFSDTSHFIKRFKDYTGLTPGNFKAEIYKIYHHSD